LTANALALVDQVVSGSEYKHYFAREVYYSGTQNGPHVIIYLSNAYPTLTGTNSVSLGGGVRVDAYTNMTTNTGAVRYSMSNYAGGNVTWGSNDLVLSDCRSTLIGGVRYDLPAAYVTQNNKANLAAAGAMASNLLLGFFVLVALFWTAFRKR